jgi:serine/threonine protein kinase/Tfp pilus assembly protein PilF
VNDSRTFSEPAESVCRRLERLWDAGQQPDVSQLLAEAGPLAVAEVARALTLDQWRRWHVGERISAEDYLERFPQVAAAPDAAVELIYGEMLVREELGEQPAAEEYLSRFPRWAEGLRQQLQLHQDLRRGSARTVRLAEWSDRTTVRVEHREAVQFAPGLPNIPGYEVLEVLGRGGMGVVYKARQLALKRFVALKMILNQPGSQTQELARFRVEAEAVARLQHPNIVQIYEVGEWRGEEGAQPQPFLALEFVDGGNLAQRLAPGQLEPRVAAELAETLARTMHVAHLRGIVHRDLKPANILMRIADRGLRIEGESATPMVTDFGLAKLLDAEAGQTRTGDLLGTPRYMAPEQAQGRVREVGPVTDVYSLGAILYHTLTGQPPFQGATALETVLQVVQQEPKPPRQLQPRLPRDLETICLKCLKKEGGQRYGSALELADDLRRFLRGEPIQARPVGAWERAAKWVRRRPALAAAVIASMLAVIGSITGFVIYLNAALDHAQKEWQKQSERAQRAERRSEVQDLVLRAETAARAQDWQGAKLHAAQALRRMGEEEEGSDLRQRAAEVQGEAQKHLDDQAHLNAFKKHRSEAFSRWGLLAGGASPTDVEKTQKAARAALAEFHVDPESGAALAVSKSYAPTDKSALVADCYELLLLLADAVASPRTREQTRQAERILQRAARLGVVTQAYHRRLANYSKLLGDEAEARRAADLSARVPPAGALDYFLAGQEQYQSGQFALARSSFERALLAQADHFWARYFHSLCQLRLHQADAAAAGFTACLGQRRDLVWLYVLRALAQTERAEFKAAEDDFDAALACQPDADALYGVHVNRASLRLAQNRLQDAIADLRAAISLKPDHYEAHLNLAQIFRQRKEWDAADDELKLALSPTAQLPSLYRACAQLALDRGDTKAAKDDFRQAIQRETNVAQRADDHVEIGRIFQRAQSWGEALNEYEAALQERTDHPAALRGKGATLLELKRGAEAMGALDQYLKIAPASAEMHRLRGLARSRTGDYRGALEDDSRALQLEPTASGYAHRGWLYLAPGIDAFSLALDDFNQAIRLGPATGDMYAGRGLAQVQLGKREDAIKDAEKAAGVGSDEPLHWCKLARIYSLALTRLGNTPKGRDADLRLGYQKEAVRLIHRALDKFSAKERPFFWKEFIHPDQALQPLRELSKEFHDLEAAQALKLPR